MAAVGCIICEILPPSRNSPNKIPPNARNKPPKLLLSTFGTPFVLRRAIWLESDQQFRAAAESLIKIRSSKEVKADTAEGRAPDFSHEQPHKSIEPEVSFTLDRKPWEERVRAYTKAFRESPDILNSIVTFSALGQNSYLVNTEGTQLQTGQIRYRLELFIQGKATDGMNIERRDGNTVRICHPRAFPRASPAMARYVLEVVLSRNCASGFEGSIKSDAYSGSTDQGEKRRTHLAVQINDEVVFRAANFFE